MKTTKRFENAVMKLYNAFHENRLNAFDCKACAVGNICNNSELWSQYLGHNVVVVDGKIKDVRENEPFLYPFKRNGYNECELHEIEKIFLFNWIGERHDDGFNKELQFKGLCAVVQYLAELDNIPNPMDYTKLFETENEQPKYELNF